MSRVKGHMDTLRSSTFIMSLPFFNVTIDPDPSTKEKTKKKVWLYCYCLIKKIERVVNLFYGQ